MVALRDANESRPAGNGTAIKITDGRSADESTDLLTLSARGDHALLLTRVIRGGKVRRRILLSLDAAERAADRVVAAGYPPPTITLVRLLPVGHVDLDGLGGGGR